jgi:hypothetical protein
MIIKLIENNKSEKYILAKPKNEFGEEYNNKDNKDKKVNDIKEEEISQEYINEKIKCDLFNYKDFVEKNKNSKNYPWNITTYLYDIKQKNFDDIIEGYILACTYFIEKENDIKYAIDYIKELIEYYHDKINNEEKNQLRNKIFDLFVKANDLAIKAPKIYYIYINVIYIFIVNEIMELKSFENFIKDAKIINKDLISISITFNEAYKYIPNDIFKNILNLLGSNLENELVKND